MPTDRRRLRSFARTAGLIAFLIFVVRFSPLTARAAASPEVVVNEIMYHPPGTNRLEQWFELFNAGAKTADLAGWQVTRGVRFQFPPGTILPPAGYLVVAADADTFRASHPAVTNFVAGWTGQLGHVIEISDRAGKAVNTVEFYSEGDWATRELGPAQYDHQGWIWNAPADGRGASLELINPHLPNSYAHNWAPHPNAASSPGQPNSVASSNAPPFISAVAHWPKIPQPADPVSITARIVDETVATTAVTLHWRLDGESAFREANMLDDGAHGDGLAGDGLYAATIPPQADHAVVEFYLTATDASGQTRPYPSFVPPPNSSRTANLLYQVDSASTPSAQPVYRLIMKDAERAELYALGRGCPDSDSDAEMNATWIASDGVLSNGTSTEVRYNAGLRNRGHGSRQANPNNYHLNLPEDRPWKNQTGLNLNSQYAHSQVIGSALMRAAGLSMPDSRAVQVRVNSTNLMALRPEANSFGSYAANEQYDPNFIQRSFPLDPGGNSYRGIRDQASCIPSLSGVADLRWRGADWAIPAYTNAYFKQNNFLANDWSDLIQLLGVLNVTNGTTAATYVSDVASTLNVEQWMRYMAANTLLDNEETALANGIGDDYALYRGTIDSRFQVLPYDLDTVLGRGAQGVSPRNGIFRMTNLPVMDRFMKTPSFAPIYYRQLQDLADTVFLPERLNPMLDQLLRGFVPPATIELMQEFAASHRAYVLSQIPLSLEAAVPLPSLNGYFHATNNSILITGRANAIATRSILLNGIAADWVAWQGAWALDVPLLPGLNRLTVRALGTADVELARTNLDIWLDHASPQVAPASIGTDTRWSAAEGPYLLSSTLTIEPGATLTIDPGTTLYLGTAANLVVANGGRLLAEGTDAAPIRFSRPPGTTGTWGGIIVNGSSGSPETRLTHAYLEFNGTTALHSTGGTLFLDSLEFGSTDKQYLSLDSSSFVVSHCHFPTPTAGFEPVHGTGGVKAGGHGIFLRNFFGAPNGYNDVVDFTGGQRGGPIVCFLDNVFAGSGDDGLDLDGTDAWVENNIFLHIHQNGAPDSSSAVSGGDDGANTSEVTVIGNLFFDCDNAATAKQGNFFTLLNNTIVHTTRNGGSDFASGVVNVRDTTPGLTTFGRGYYLEGNIITDAEQLVRNYDPAQCTVTFQNNLLPVPWTLPETNNYVGDPLLKHIPTVAEAQFDSWAQAQIMRDWFSLQTGSPARGTGPLGKDQGAVVSSGVYLSGAPSSPTRQTSATLTVGINRTGLGIPAGGWPQGSGFVAYKWRLDGANWSDETSIREPIILTGLSPGSHLVQVVGKTDAGLYQDDPRLGAAAALTERTWIVDPNAPPSLSSPLRLNEVLAKSGTSASDFIELYNSGSSTVDLSGGSIRSGTNALQSFTFPAATSVLPGSFLILFADRAVTNSGLHLGFTLDAGGDSLTLLDSTGRLLDTLRFGTQPGGLSIGRSFDGTWTLCQPTLGSVNQPLRLGDPRSVRINEWLAHAEFSAETSFLELYNTSPEPVALGGLFLSDAAGAPGRFPIPPLSFIGGHAWVTFLTDGQNSPRHVDFKLSAAVGQISLAASDLTLIDLVSYGPQTTDISEGRSPSGASLITFFPYPTPGAPNPGTLSTAVTNITRETVPVITLTNLWRYNAEGLDPGPDWATPTFVDSAWSTGEALFYHGNAASRMPIPVATQLPFRNPEQSAFYFRTHFNYAGPTNQASLRVTLLVDDGAVIYLNGAELLRRNLPAGPISYSTRASSTVSDATLVGPLSAPADSLVPGDNVIAVEVHQVNLTSTDVAMAIAVEIVNSTTNIVANSDDVFPLLNEVLAKSASPPDGADWAELYNPSTNRLNLAGMSLTDDLATPLKFQFPAGTFLEPNSFLTVSFSPNLAVSSTNTGFAIDRDGGTIYLFDTPGGGGTLLDAIRYGIQIPGLSIGRVPDGAGSWGLTEPSPGGKNHSLATARPDDLKINEWLASSSTGNDWFELFNPLSTPMALGGLFLTDDLADRAKFHVAPLSFIGTGTNAFLRLEADSSPGKGARHVDFNLAAKGEALGIYDLDGLPIDRIVFGPQQADVSEGRLPDGSDTIVTLPALTPGASNSSLILVDSDNDGLPDDWERSHFGNLSRTGLDDFDGDGFGDLEEFRAGTDPANPSDFLSLRALGADGAGFRLAVRTVPGKNYALEYSDDLATAWQKLTSLSGTSPAEVQVSDPVRAAPSRRFYRLRLE